MYSSMADVAGLMNDNCYDDALDNIWKNITNTKMHITGGLGAIHGIEGFGDEYDLPNKEAYNETCAANCAAASASSRSRSLICTCDFLLL